MLERLRSALRGNRSASLTEGGVGIGEVATGAEAVGYAESRWADVSIFGSRFPATLMETAMSRSAGGTVNAFGRTLAIDSASSPRSALAGALGSTLSGSRVSTFCNTSDLEREIDLLRRAAGEALPLVVTTICRASSSQGVPSGGGHEVLHVAARTGAVVLVAATVQDAVDLALAGRKLAEDALVPVVVAMDVETALALQHVRLPDDATITRFLGRPDATVHASNAFQTVQFGQHRRRVPVRHNTERPSLTGSLLDAPGFALGRVSRLAHNGSADPAPAMAALAERTGRPLEPLLFHKVGDADRVLIVMGSVWETAVVAADRLRAARKKVGVIGVRALAPFPSHTVAEALKGKKLALVLERTLPDGGGEPPLTELVRSALHRHQDVKAKSSRGAVASVVYGLGGYPVRAADIAAACRRLETDVRSPLFLGVSFEDDSPTPKRRVLLDHLRREFTGANDLGVRSTEPLSKLLPPEAVTLEFHRAAGSGVVPVTSAVAALMQRVLGGHLRGRSEIGWDSWGSVEIDRLIHGSLPFLDPGDDIPTDYAVWCGAGAPPPPGLADRVGTGGAVLIEREPGARSLWDALNPAFKRAIDKKSLRLFAVNRAAGTEDADHDRMIGAILGMLARDERADIASRNLFAAQRDLLAGRSEDEIEARLDRLQEGFDAVMRVEPPTGTPALGDATAANEPPSRPIPQELRRLGSTEGATDDLARFADQVGVMYNRGAVDRLTPDPHLALGTLPARTALLSTLSSPATELPRFEVTQCTGCGACWSACPDAAIRATVLSGGRLLEQGMQLVKERGSNAEGLRMAAGKLAGRLHSDAVSGPAGPQLDTALSRFLTGSKLPEDKRTGVETAMVAVRDVLGPLPLACTEPLFSNPESNRKGTGEFLTLAIDPDVCKGCGLCVSVCEPEALLSEPRNPQRIGRARESWDLVQALADPSAESTERLAGAPATAPFAGALLGPAGRVIGGIDGAEPGSGPKLAVRQALGLAVSALGRTRESAVAQVAELKQTLSDAVRERMAGALPTGDLDALAHGLESIDRPDVDLGDLTNRIETVIEGDRLDTTSLRRLVEAARGVNDIHWHLVHGDGGEGRAPFSIVAGVEPATAWMGTFPSNPLSVPVVFDASGDVVDLALGIWEGRLGDTLREVRSLRAARRELSDTREKQSDREAALKIGWEDLTPEEKSLCPPVIVVAGERALAERSMASVSRLMATNAPIKFIVISDFQPGMDGATGLVTASETSFSLTGDAGLFALVHPRTLVLQSSIGHSGHLESGLKAAFASDGPAWIRVLAPSPMRGGFAPGRVFDRARTAVDSHAWPLFLREAAARGAAPPDVTIEGGFPSSDAELSENQRFAWSFLRRLAAPPASRSEIAPEPSVAGITSEQHEATLAALREDYENRLAAQRSSMQIELAGRIRNRLRSLLSRSGNGKA